ncbi:hypothetical protein D3C80_1466160 [compost metagenome]
MLNESDHTGHDRIPLTLPQRADRHDRQHICGDIENGGRDQQRPGTCQTVWPASMNQRTTACACLLVGARFLLVQLVALSTNQNACINRPHEHPPLTVLPKSDGATSPPLARPGSTTN